MHRASAPLFPLPTKITQSALSKEIKSLALSCHAGHGLTRENLIPLLEQKFFDEYNIGHWIIAESIFSGLEYIVKDLKNLMSEENACLL